MNFDRFGYFDPDYRFWPDLIAAGKHYGYDPDDAIYRERNRQGGICPHCRTHRTGDRYFPCDVEQARAADIEAAGYPATTCRTCARSMPEREDQAVACCWSCESNQPKRRRITNGGVHIDDGVGCVEKVPSWMADYDGNPGHLEPRQ